MKRLLYLLPLFLVTACATTSGIKSLKNPDASATTVASCDSCVEVRIKNTGADDISGITIENNNRESYYFEGVKAGKTSAYQKFNSLCSCGYSIDVAYFKTAANQAKKHNSCQNIVRCTDFLKGKVTIEIKTGKLPDDLTAPDTRKVKQEVYILKD